MAYLKRVSLIPCSLESPWCAFLICWLPFFSVNVGIGICLLRQSTDHPACVVLDRLMSACTWLGYVNSLLNPMIYTIFNLEFRMAFKRLLGIK
ncbi:D(4) dopamine receptor [Fasciola gigantica]|uniref:D(4) dopamine receptor n=1 Tax=Fasciola gigantica TaxID=46835 RepID=A0A504YUL8_FASGI|nr:D(4) dopamine receptor [Fasciola gigantica]